MPPSAVLFSILVLALGIVLGILQALRAWRALRDPEGKPPAHVRSRMTRRLFIASLFLAVGILLVLGTTVLDFRNAPRFFFAYWGAVLALTLLLAILPLVDLRANSRDLDRLLERDMAKLQEEMLKSKHP